MERSKLKLVFVLVLDSRENIEQIHLDFCLSKNTSKDIKTLLPSIVYTRGHYKVMCILIYHFIHNFYPLPCVTNHHLFYRYQFQGKKKVKNLAILNSSIVSFVEKNLFCHRLRRAHAVPCYWDRVRFRSNCLTLFNNADINIHASGHCGVKG
jgi:hypothetical protein